MRDALALDALALLELGSIARGYRVLDAMVKESPIQVVHANLVEPGKFLILYGGGVAEVESAHTMGRAIGADDVLDHVLLPYVRPEVWRGIGGQVATGALDTVGIVEGSSVAGVLEAADRSLKEAEVTLCGLRLTPALGGKAYYVFEGLQADVEAGIAVGVAILEGRGRLVKAELIARPHPEFLGWVLTPAPFAALDRAGVTSATGGR